MVLWCNWLSLWTLNPAIRVQIPVEPFFLGQLRSEPPTNKKKYMRICVQPRRDSNPQPLDSKSNALSNCATRSVQLIRISPWHDWRSWQRVGLIILRSWVRSPHCAHITHIYVLCKRGTCGAVGSASVLCTGGPGFEPLQVHISYITPKRD